MRLRRRQSGPHPSRPDHPLEAPRSGIDATLLGSLLLAFIALAIFSWLADGVLAGQTWQLDSSLRAFAYAHSSPPLTTLMRAISALATPAVLALLSAVLILWFLRAHWQRATVWLVVDMAGAFLLTVELKRFFARPRPLPFSMPEPATYSFPSGHALASFCFYFVAAGLLTARIQNSLAKIVLWAAAALLVVGIGVSRIYLGMHYPSDVLAGYAAAAIWVVALIWLDRMSNRRRKSRER